MSSCTVGAHNAGDEGSSIADALVLLHRALVIIDQSDGVSGHVAPRLQEVIDALSEAAPPAGTT